MKENIFRTHNCNEISLDDVGKKVRISGFVQTIRDFGGLVFLDIRDMYGITQVVTSADSSDVDFSSHIPIESTVCVSGTVKKRDPETVNEKLKTGLVEIVIEDIKILSYYKNNIIITGIRLKEEIENIKNNFSNVIVIKVVRPNYDNGLSIEQKKHITETDLDDYTPKYVIINEEKENLNDAVIKMLEEVEYE